MVSLFCRIITFFRLDTQMKKHGVCEFMQAILISNLVREFAYPIGYEASA